MIYPTNFSDAVDRSSPIPAYQQVADSLLNRIADEFENGDRLPSENELAIEYRVSRITIRQALAQLEKDGTIQKFQGKGVFVNRKPQSYLIDLRLPSKKNKAISMSALTQKASVTALKVPNKKAMRFLKTTEQDPQIYVERLFAVDNNVVGINQAWFPMKKVPDMDKKSLINNSITKTLRTYYGYEFDSVENYIGAISMDAYTAKILNSSYASPAIKFDSIYFLPNQEIIEYASTVWVGNQTNFHLMIMPED